ncbi:olfactory receptor 2T34-like [Limulus polyphemus]|uniref:Olfactory receptor 2T34-like n=1 Tax=Limulus polyphemus TaxID=6850 RepID=A0ABM1C0D8_LIMPO|nr:olfactory receptor 2T34-like [Limulus polyphemus]
MIVLLWHNQGYIKTPNNVFLLHLSLVDTVFCLVLLISHSVFGAVVPTDPSPAGCNVHGYLWTLLPVVVVWTVCGLSCDRYAAISTPLHYSRLVNTRRAAMFLTAGWILGAILALPPLLDVCPYVYRDSRGACAATCTAGTPAELGYAVTYVALSVVVPVLVILLCNLHIFNIARYHRHRIVTAIYEVTLRAQATVTHQRNPCYLSKFKGRNAFFTIVQLVGSVTVLTVPYFSVMIWEAATGRERSTVLVSMTTILLGFAPSVNAYVYGVKSRLLRHTFKFLLQRHLYKQQMDRTSQRGRPGIRRRYSAPVLSAMWDRGANKRTLSRQFSDCSVRTLAADRGSIRPIPLENTTTCVGRTQHRPSTCSTNPLLNEPVGKTRTETFVTSYPPTSVHSTAV